MNKNIKKNNDIVFTLFFFFCYQVVSTFAHRQEKPFCKKREAFCGNISMILYALSEVT